MNAKHVALQRVHRQRIGAAVTEALAGAEVTFALEWNSDSFGGAKVLWVASGRRNVLASGGRVAMESIRELAQEEFRVRLIASAGHGDLGESSAA